MNLGPVSIGNDLEDSCMYTGFRKNAQYPVISTEIHKVTHMAQHELCTFEPCLVHTFEAAHVEL